MGPNPCPPRDGPILNHADEAEGGQRRARHPPPGDRLRICIQIHSRPADLEFSICYPVDGTVPPPGRGEDLRGPCIASPQVRRKTEAWMAAWAPHHGPVPSHTNRTSGDLWQAVTTARAEGGHGAVIDSDSW